MLYVDWSSAPSWAKWCAMDSRGVWYWFESRPVLMNRHTWGFRGLFLVADISIVGNARPNWKDTLEARP